MKFTRHEPNECMRTIALLGSGFSGVVTAYQLVQHAKEPLRILSFDGSIYAKTGIAYGTHCPRHLLNVTAKKMSALQGDPDHFLNWLQQQPQSWRHLDPSFATLKIHPDAFLPRMIYGAYLKHIINLTQAASSKKGIIVEWIPEEIVDITKKNKTTPIQLTLIAASGKTYDADCAILAIGTPWTREITHSENRTPDTGYLTSPWPILTDPKRTKEWLQGTSVSTEICLIGSGLTMIDVVVSLHAADFKGTISVISRHGLLPETHDLTLQALPLFTDPEQLSKTILNIFKTLRRFNKDEYDWRAIIDALRPITPALWEQLPLLEKRRFLRHLFPRWNIFRHRTPQEGKAILDHYQKKKQLNLIKASATAIELNDHKIFRVALIDTLSGRQYHQHFDKVINCSGPNFSLNTRSQRLIDNLILRGWIQGDSLGLGLDSKHYQLIGRHGAMPLFAIGSLLFGSRFETIAVPELRQQCHELARIVLQCFVINHC